MSVGHLRSGCVHDLQAKHLLKGIEVAVPVEKLVLSFQTERSNQTIDSLADRVTAPAQVPVVLGCRNSQGGTAGLKDLELQEVGLDSGAHVLVRNTLQYLAKNEVCQPEPLPLQFAVQPKSFWIFRAPQIVDPYRRVDDDHRAYTGTRAWRDWLRSPSQPTFPRSRRIEP